jgi:hypothetical protein
MNLQNASAEHFDFGEKTELVRKALAAISETMGAGRLNTITPVIMRKDGTVEVGETVKNSRVDAGASFVANQISGTVAAVAKYLALTSSTTLSPAKGDTTLASEITTNGLARASATYGGYTAPSSLNGTASFTLTYTWTATATQTVGGIGIFNAASAGTLLAEAALSQNYTLNSGDSLAITYTITI